MNVFSILAVFQGLGVIQAEPIFDKLESLFFFFFLRQK